MQYRMVSYADNFEDVLLQRAFPAEGTGFYIDVGAFDPVEHSITKHFYERGWRGINVEPNPGPFAKLQADRPRDVNLNLGLSDREGKLTLFEPPEGCWSVDREILTGWFGAKPGDLKERIIPVTTLARLCEDHVPEGTTIDFLKVDVEGHEHEVIGGGIGRDSGRGSSSRRRTGRSPGSRSSCRAATSSPSSTGSTGSTSERRTGT